MVRTATHVLLGAMVWLAAAGVAAAPSARALVKDGLRDFESERYEEALDKFEKAKEADPEFEGLDLNIGHTLMKLGRHDEAEERYKEILNSEAGRKYLGDINYNRGVSRYQRGEQIIPDPTIEGLLKQGYLNQATTPDGQPSVELEPDALEALKQALSEYQQSLEHTKTAVSQMPDSRQARLNYELTRRQVDKTQELLELFTPPEQQQQDQDQQDNQDQEQQEEQQQQNQQNEQDQQDSGEDQTQQEQQQQPNEDEQQQNEGQQQDQQQNDDEQQQDESQQSSSSDERNEEQEEPSTGQSQTGQPEEGMRPEDAMTLLNSLNDEPQEEQLREMIRYQMRGMRSLNPDW